MHLECDRRFDESGRGTDIVSSQINSRVGKYFQVGKGTLSPPTAKRKWFGIYLKSLEIIESKFHCYSS